MNKYNDMGRNINSPFCVTNRSYCYN